MLKAMGDTSLEYGDKFVKFEETSYRAIRLAQRRKWTLIGSIALALGVLVFILVNYQVKQSKTNELTNHLMLAENVFSQELEAFQTGFQNLPEQQKLDYLKKKPVHDNSAPLFKALYEKSPNHPVGFQAGLRYASILLEGEQWTQATEVLETLKSHLPSFAIAQSQVRRALAGAYAKTNDFEKALIEMEFLEKLPRNPLLHQHKLFKSEILYLAGKKELAKQSLIDIANNPVVETQIREQAKLWLSFWGL